MLVNLTVVVALIFSLLQTHYSAPTDTLKLSNDVKRSIRAARAGASTTSTSLGCDGALNARRQFYIGYGYMVGFEIPAENFEKAKTCLELSAEQGHGDSYAFIASIFETQQQLTKAEEYYEKAQLYYSNLFDKTVDETLHEIRQDGNKEKIAELDHNSANLNEVRIRMEMKRDEIRSKLEKGLREVDNQLSLVKFDHVELLKGSTVK